MTSDKNINLFKNKINDIIFSDDEKILDLAQTFFEDIKIENISAKDLHHKIILHAKLNVLDNNPNTFNFEDFILLLRKCKRCGHCDS